MKSGPKPIPVFERLCKRLLPAPNSCLEWQGWRDKGGYGLMSKGRRGEGKVGTHRVAWEEAYGPIPEGLFVLHTCDNPPCCEPTHLFLGTQADNLADMSAKGRRAEKEGCGRSSLTELKVSAIRVDTRVQELIASDYGVSQSMISMIKTGRYW